MFVIYDQLPTECRTGRQLPAWIGITGDAPGVRSWVDGSNVGVWECLGASSSLFISPGYSSLNAPGST
jgi:hypothetical protein